jgi:ABC-type antimicrobial peptide transport system permease subunit
MPFEINENKRWWCQTAVTLLGIVITAAVSLIIFSKQTQRTHKDQEVNLANNLAEKFDENKTFSQIRMAIEHQKALYKPWGGRFDNDDINMYLNFFEDIGFYNKYGVLDIEIIDQYYGSYIIETYENKEIKKYINDLRKNSKERGAFFHFEALAKQLENLPERHELTGLMRQTNK